MINQNSGTGTNHVQFPCGCVDVHEPFCDAGRYEVEQRFARLLEVARRLQGELSFLSFRTQACDDPDAVLSGFNEV